VIAVLVGDEMLGGARRVTATEYVFAVTPSCAVTTTVTGLAPAPSAMAPLGLPDVTLTAVDGTPFNLRSEAASGRFAGRTLLLSFFRGHW